MALTIDLSTEIADNRESWTLTDSTDYGVGGNPARSACRVFVTSNKMNADNTVAEELTVTSNNSDPETDTEWTITYTDDGWYKTNFVIIEDAYSALTTYAQYDAVYDTDDTVYRSKVANNLGNALNDTTYWESVSDPASLSENKDTNEESLNITSQVYQRTFTADSEYEFANQLSDECGCADCDELETLQKYNLFIMAIDAMAIADSRSEVIDGEETARRVESRFIDCE